MCVDNAIDEAGAAALADALKSNTTLETVDLGGTATIVGGEMVAGNLAHYALDFFAFHRVSQNSAKDPTAHQSVFEIVQIPNFHLGEGNLSWVLPLHSEVFSAVQCALNPLRRECVISAARWQP